MQARRISSEYIYAPLGPICLEHQDLCRGYSALGPSRVPPIYFYGLVLAASSRHEEPGESLARADAAHSWLRKRKCYRKHGRELLPLLHRYRGRENTSPEDTLEQTT